jgi:hypothetical protein
MKKQNNTLVYLNKKQKTNLIEMLLIVGSILIAFGKIKSFSGDIIFVLFLFSSIAYYIILQSSSNIKI